ncbi:ureidoglycolate lyase [Variovorax sp. VNK109]|uniref:ureidoglycolate lyase n=1 Tax=Variovorax sp. VNK109 TaxID=3400919 RepID=UPI003C0B213A
MNPVPNPPSGAPPGALPQAPVFERVFEGAMVSDLHIEPLTPEAFAPFGTVMAALEDGVPFSTSDAQLELSQGIPRFYVMRIPGRGMEVRQITRHVHVTQALASVGGYDWVMAVAPPYDVDDPEAEPALEDIRAFRIPGNVAVMLRRGTWHAGPLFESQDASFFNLELADTNITDHHTCKLTRRYGTVLRLVD